MLVRRSEAKRYAGEFMVYSVASSSYFISLGSDVGALWENEDSMHYALLNGGGSSGLIVSWHAAKEPLAKLVAEKNMLQVGRLDGCPYFILPRLNFCIFIDGKYYSFQSFLQMKGACEIGMYDSLSVENASRDDVRLYGG
jgi:hypothetical protein